MYYVACGLEIPLSRTTKTSTYMNHGFDDTRNQNPSITREENNRLGHTDLFVQVSNKESRGFEFESHYYHTVGKKSTVKDLNKTEIGKMS